MLDNIREGTEQLCSQSKNNCSYKCKAQQKINLKIHKKNPKITPKLHIWCYMEWFYILLWRFCTNIILWIYILQRVVLVVFFSQPITDLVSGLWKTVHRFALLRMKQGAGSAWAALHSVSTGCTPLAHPPPCGQSLS